MKYSESPEYLEYGRCIANNDLDGAKRQIEMCLRIPELTQDSNRHSGLLVKMGDLCFLQGDRLAASKYYKEALAVDKNSLFMKYLYAKFLFEKIHDYDSALKICEEIIELCTNNDFSETDDDFGSQKYIKMTEELKDNFMDPKKSARPST